MPPLPTLKILYHAFSGMARDRRYRSLAKTGRPLKEKTVLSHNVKVRLDDETHVGRIKQSEKDRQKAADYFRHGKDRIPPEWFRIFSETLGTGMEFPKINHLTVNLINE